MKKTIAIIGSGPSALMLATTLNESSFDVTIYDRNFAPARKFLVAGDGGFNLTHSEELDQFINRYTPGSYLEKSLRSFTNMDLRDWLKQIGIETYVGSSKRVFPVKDIKPIQVLNAILKELENKKVQFRMKHEWKGWNERGELVFENETGVQMVNADFVVFALGGASWSKTGSDGCWTPYFAKRNIEIKPFLPSNCAYAINWTASFISQAEGQPLKNISVICNGREKKGEVVITKFGMEGGAVYALSPEIRRQLTEQEAAMIFIDLVPALSTEEIKQKLRSVKSRTISKLLADGVGLNKAKIELTKSILSKQDFMNIDTLAESIKRLPIQLVGMATLDEAISTVGGISVNETDENFQLHKLPNHFVIGEMLDWDAPTGGYLLQACFSMGSYLGEKLNEDENRK